MNTRYLALKLPGNPVLQVLSLLGAGVALIGAVLLGAMLLAVVLALAIVVGAVFVVRLWWLRRKYLHEMSKRSKAQRQLLEAEYTVVDEREPRRRHD